MSCKNKKVDDPKQLVDDETILQLNDSITSLVSAFQLNKDTTSLLHALALSDTVLSLDLTEEGQFHGTSRKSQILTVLGRKKEAFLLQDALLNIDPNSIERLIYNGVSSKLRAQPDSAEMFFSQALQLCNKQLILNPSNIEYSISMATVYLYQGKKEEAIQAIDKALVAAPEDEILVPFKAGIDKAYVNAQAFLNESN